MNHFNRILLGVFLSMGVHAQNPLWIVPNKVLVNINGQPPTTLPYSSTQFNTSIVNQPNAPWDGYDGQEAKYASNIQTDAAGNLLFFIVDGYTYDKNGDFIGVMQPDLIATGSAEVAVLPVPGACNKYYIFTTTVNEGIFLKKPYVFLLDMSALNPYADAVLQGNNCEYFGAFIDEFGTAQDIALGIPLSSFLHGMEFSPSSPSPGKASGVFYAITPKRTDNSHHIFISNGEGFFTFNVNENGIEEIAYNTFGSSEFNPYNLRGEMEVTVLKNGNYRIAVPYVPGQMGMGTNVINEYIYTAEVDSTGFAIDSTILRLPLYASLNTSGNNQIALTRGLEFSEGGEFLYVTHTTTPQQPAAFEYYNFSTGNDTLIPVPGQNISDFQYSMIEMAFDQKLMLANENGLYALDNANDPTSGISLFSSFDYEPNAEGESLPSLLKSYMLQDQIDGTDYLAPFTGDVTCCIESSTYDVDLFVASISESWTPSSNPLNNGSGDEVYIKQEIKIPAGKTITIKNMELHFAPGARLVVENGIGITGIGGKLILDSTTLTADA